MIKSRKKIKRVKWNAQGINELREFFSFEFLITADDWDI